LWLLGTAAFFAPSLAFAAIVVGSSGPSAKDFPLGKKLDDAGQLTLRAGDTLTVLDRNGTRILRGAGTFAVSRAATTSNAAAYAMLTRQRSSQRVRTGAVRDPSSGSKVASPNLWYVDLGRPGTKCLVAADNVRLWRADAVKGASYRVTASDAGHVMTNMMIAFDAGAMVAPWDNARLPIANGTRVTIADAGGKSAGTFQFAVLAAQPDNPESLAASLIENGCTAQLELLSNALTTVPK
jgi:hypothetical protein